MSECLLSVGLDVGTTSTQLVVSLLTVENRASSFAVPDMDITERSVLYKSPVYFTPLLDESHVDGAAIRAIVKAEYQNAGIRREDVDTGAIIITGETSRKENARAVLDALSDYAGDFVVATAGPDLESVLAAKGAGAVELSRTAGKPVLHMDIGGGTSNLAYIEDGKTVNKAVAYSAEVTNVVDDYIFILQGISSTISDTWCYLSDMTKKENDNETLYYNDVEYKNHSNKYLTKSGSDTTKYYIINNKYVNLDDKAQNISYKKVVNGVECDYYVRVFEKVPNFKNASAVTSSEYDIYKNDSELIHEYQDKKYDFESHVSRLAFAKNIYGDDVGEIVFTDDIDISNLIDNLGRPISTLYIMFFKSNKGYKEWYGFHPQDDKKNIDINSDNVTYSHCFGMLTCGYETSDESICNSDIDSIYTINNIGESSQGISISKLNKGRDDYYYDTEIAYDVDKKFYGDICCYDGYNIVEESIQPIMHRFNTAQRESNNSLSKEYYQKFNYDNIIYDDYDINQNFTIKTSVVDNVNQKKEGYYYKPFYPIEIKTFGSLNSVSPDFLKIIGIKKYDGENGRYYSISTLSYHYLSPGDKSMIYDTEQDKYYTLVTIENNESNYKKFYFVAYDEKGTEKVDLDISDYSKFKLFKIDNLEVSSHASLLKDGTCRFVWRDLYNNGFSPTSAKSTEEYPFTNGAFYINKRIDIYVRRQDPYGVYGLYDGAGIDADISGDDSYTEVVSDNNYVKSDDIKC